MQRFLLTTFFLLLPAAASAQAGMNGTPAGQAPTGALTPPPASPPAPAAAPPTSPAGPAAPAAPLSNSGPLTNTNPLGNFGLSPAPVSPPVPTAVPGQYSLPLFPDSLSPGQTLPAAAPNSFALVTPHVPPLTLTADSAVTLAVRRNLGVLAALREVVSARAGVRSASALSPPIFTVGPALQTGGTTDGLLFEQPLELNGTRDARAGIARAQERLASAQALVQLQGLVYAARLNFYALARAQARLRLARDGRAAAEQFDALARTQVTLGARPGIEQRQTAVEAARARALEAQASGEEQAARALLNSYLGRAPLDSVETNLGTTSEVATDLVLAQQQALRSRGEIAVAEAQRDVPLAQARLSRAQGRPDIAPEFRISQITPKYMDAGLGVVVTIPLDYGTRQNLIRQQEQTAAAGGDRLTGTQAQVRSEVVQAASRLAGAQDVLREYDSGLLENARAVRDAAQTGFTEGATTIIAVLEAERTFRAVQAERLTALGQVMQARAEFDRAAGVVPAALLSELRKDLADK